MPRLNRRSRQETTARPIRVLVAAPQPLQRELVRFFLEEAGCRVVALVASAEDAVCLVTSKRPDAVILHESLAAMVGAGFVQKVRQGSTSMKIVVVTPQPERAWSGPSRGADAFVEEWVGMQELGILLQRLCRDAPAPVQSARLHAERGTAGSSTVAGEGEGIPQPPRAVGLPMGSQARWYERVRGALAASVILILLLLGTGLLRLPATSEGRRSAASAYLTHAYSSLEVLSANMRAGRAAGAIAKTARRLIAERAAAIASGADTTRLDAAIEEQVSAQLANVTDEQAAAVEFVLDGLVRAQGPPAGPKPAGDALFGAQPHGHFHPPAVAPTGRNPHVRHVAESGAQGNEDAEPGAQANEDANSGPQANEDAETGADTGALGNEDADPGAQANEKALALRDPGRVSSPTKRGGSSQGAEEEVNNSSLVH